MDSVGKFFCVAIFLIAAFAQTPCQSIKDEDSIAGDSNVSARAGIIASSPRSSRHELNLRLGVVAGISSVNFAYSNSDNDEYDLVLSKIWNYKFQPGGSLGIILRTDNQGRFDFEGGMEISMLGSSRNYNFINTPSSNYIGTLGTTDTVKVQGGFQTSLLCVSVPINVILNLTGGNSGLSLFLGPGLSYILAAREQSNEADNGITAPGGTENESIVGSLNRFDMQLQGGILKYFPLGALPLFAEAQYSHGLLNIGREGYWGIDFRTTEIRLALGVFLHNF